MSALPAVCFTEDVCDALRISRSTFKRLRRAGAFPIPELPSLDDRPRFSGAAVQAFIEAGADQFVTGRVSHRTTVPRRSPRRTRKPVHGKPVDGKSVAEVTR